VDRLTVTEIRALVAGSNAEQVAVIVTEYADDPRAGVRAVIAAVHNRLEAAERERQRLHQLSALQRALHEQGWVVIAGIDEVGRGALAGPVTAAAVVLGAEVAIDGIDDSKRLTPDRRRSLDATIRSRATCVSLAHVWPEQIDSCGIQQATRLAMLGALEPLRGTVDHVIVDGLLVELGLPTTAVVKGDSRVAAVAAASIVAKVARDALMIELDAAYPGYGLAHNKGYGSTDHLECLAKDGPTRVHRRSFAPCSQTQLF
jgi:ribonuclease HII